MKTRMYRTSLRIPANGFSGLLERYMDRHGLGGSGLSDIRPVVLTVIEKKLDLYDPATPYTISPEARRLLLSPGGDWQGNETFVGWTITISLNDRRAAVLEQISTRCGGRKSWALLSLLYDGLSLEK